jgi:hypothetical protein
MGTLSYCCSRGCIEVCHAQAFWGVQHAFLLMLLHCHGVSGPTIVTNYRCIAARVSNIVCVWLTPFSLQPRSRLLGHAANELMQQITSPMHVCMGIDRVCTCKTSCR